MQLVMNTNVRQKALELLQEWATAFRGTADLTYILDMYNLMRAEGRRVGVERPPSPYFGRARCANAEHAEEWCDGPGCVGRGRGSRDAFPAAKSEWAGHHAGNKRGRGIV